MKVYIAGPYSQGDVGENVHRAIRAADEVAAAGHVPYLPHPTHFWHVCSPHPYEFWLAFDREWLAVCDAVLRLPGDSSGADGEVDLAREMGIRVVASVGAL